MTQLYKDPLDNKPPRHNKPRVLIDLDGVTRDFIGSLVEAYKKEFPRHQVKQVNSRHLENFFPIKEEIYKFMGAGYIEEIMENAAPFSGAIEALNRWASEFEIVIVTAQPEASRSSTFTWIGKHKIPTNEVHISYYKSEIDGIALLDDFVDNLEDFAATGRLAVCLDQPWNQRWKGPRVHSIEEFFEYVKDVLYQQQTEQPKQESKT